MIYTVRKKILILIVIILTSTIFGCMSSKQDILSFEESIAVLSQQVDKFSDKYQNFLYFSGISNQNIDLVIKSLNKDLELDLSVKSQLSMDGSMQNYTSQNQYDLKLNDKTQNKQIISSGDFLYSNIEYIPYFKLNYFSLDMGTGNIESEFIKSLLGGINQKRIMIDVQNKKNLIQKYVDINYILKDIYLISQCNSFYKIRTTIYKGNRSYKIGLNNQNISDCIDKAFLNYTGIVFEGFLTPTNKNQVELEIKKLQLSSRDNIINGILDPKELKLSIYNTVDKTTTSLNIKYNSKHDKITINSQYYNYSIDISKIKDYLAFDGNLIFNTNNVKQQKINLDIKGNLSLQNTGYLDIKGPQNYIIISQLLGDQFSLKDIIGQ